MRKFIVLCFHVVLFQYAVGITLFPNSNVCGLACWLENVTIFVPTQSIIYDGFNITVDNLQCENMRLGEIESSYVFPTTLMISAANIALQCTGNWAAFLHKLPVLHTSGSIEATISNSSVNFGVRLNTESDGLAHSATVTECKPIITPKVTITGSILVDIMKFIGKYVEGMLGEELETVACDELTYFVENDLSNVLSAVDKAIGSYFSPQPPTPAPPVPKQGDHSILL